MKKLYLPPQGRTAGRKGIAACGGYIHQPVRVSACGPGRRQTGDPPAEKRESGGVFTGNMPPLVYAFASGSTHSASLNTLLAIMNTPMAVATTMVSTGNAERSFSNSASGMCLGSFAMARP